MSHTTRAAEEGLGREGEEGAEEEERGVKGRRRGKEEEEEEEEEEGWEERKEEEEVVHREKVGLTVSMCVLCLEFGIVSGVMTSVYSA